MLSALLADFGRVPDVKVQTIVEPSLLGRLPRGTVELVAESAESRQRLFDECVQEADMAIVVAPELEGILLSLTGRVEEFGTKLITPNCQFVAIASDKHATAERLFAAGVPVPRGAVLMPGERCPPGFRYPAVLKRIDGAGSLGVTRVSEGDRVPADAGVYRLEEQVDGTAASVAVLCGGGRYKALQPCRQLLSSNGSYSYEGGSLPLGPTESERATGLAMRALEAMPPAVGYVGVDIVLGAAGDGSEDVVIEINPRCTTSYVGLRAATDANLAEVWYAIATGGEFVPPQFNRAVRWTAAGAVETI